MNRLGATYRLAFALAMFSTVPVVIYSFLVNWRENHSVLRARMLTCEQFGLLCSMHLQRGDKGALDEIEKQLIAREPSISAIRILDVAGNTVSQVGELPQEKRNQITRQTPSFKVSSSLFRFGKPWATLELHYRATEYQGLIAQLLTPIALGTLVNFLLFLMTLRRSLSVLDTSRVVPTRVRNTLDTIPDGIAIADAHGRIIVVNEAFQRSCGREAESLIGSGLNSLTFEPINDVLPWHHVDKESRAIVGIKVQIKHSDEMWYFNLGCSPIFDGNDKHAGSLISVQDITELENQKRVLEGTLTELEQSKEKLSERNAQLHELATKDMLTGVYNRRFLIEHLEQTWQQCQRDGVPMSVFMLDVDRFKLLNDNHGHAVGDHVLRDVAAVLRNSVASNGMVARYGGEEFCAVFSNLNSQQATSIAERVRKNIESQLELPYHVTASLGVSSTELGATSYQEMLEQADQSLYSAKHGGRNAVCCWNLSQIHREESPISHEKNLSMSVKGQESDYLSISSIRAIRDLLEDKDPFVMRHSERIAATVVLFAKGFLSEAQLNQLELAALVHEIASILPIAKANATVQNILASNDIYSFDQQQAYSEIIELLTGSKVVAEIVRCKRLFYDGRNANPDEKLSEDVMLMGRVLAVAHSYDVQRFGPRGEVLKKVKEALHDLRREAGTRLDPRLVDAFIQFGNANIRSSEASKDSCAATKYRRKKSVLTSDEGKESCFSIDQVSERIDSVLASMEEMRFSSLSDMLQRLQCSVDSAPEDELTSIHHLVSDLNDVCSTIRNTRRKIEIQSSL